MHGKYILVSLHIIKAVINNGKGEKVVIILPSSYKPTLHMTYTHITTNLPECITTAQIYLYVVTQV